LKKRRMERVLQNPRKPVDRLKKKEKWKQPTEKGKHLPQRLPARRGRHQPSPVNKKKGPKCNASTTQLKARELEPLKNGGEKGKKKRPREMSARMRH